MAKKKIIEPTVAEDAPPIEETEKTHQVKKPDNLPDEVIQELIKAHDEKTGPFSDLIDQHEHLKSHNKFSKFKKSI